uniref:Cadherin domain-containing protein n=1 Tax=Anopheles culicifacies TaxID=139723 RepID=A0A182MDY9_9DIPT
MNRSYVGVVVTHWLRSNGEPYSIDRPASVTSRPDAATPTEMTISTTTTRSIESIVTKRDQQQQPQLNNGHDRQRLRRPERPRMMVTSFLSKPIQPAGAAHSVLLLAILLVTSCTVPHVEGKLQLCEVETGQSSIILDIEESRGSSVAQHTNPPELPISGDPNDDITLELVFPKGKPTFLLDGKSLRLIHPLDRDEENLSHIVFQITCMVRSTRRKRNIPIIVRVSDVNDNPPMFINTPYETTVPEVGSALDLSTQTPSIEHWSHLAHGCSSCAGTDES